MFDLLVDGCAAVPGREVRMVSAIASEDERIEGGAGRRLDRLAAAPEDARAMRTAQVDAHPRRSGRGRGRAAVVHLEPRPFAQADDGRGVLLVEFPDARLARLTHVLRDGIGIHVVAVELERD